VIRHPGKAKRSNQGQSATMKRIWSLFSQWFTVLLAIWFVVATLQPEW
jgi:ferric iron reductase protein FhuF